MSTEAVLMSTETVGSRAHEAHDNELRLADVVMLFEQFLAEEHSRTW